MKISEKIIELGMDYIPSFSLEKGSLHSKYKKVFESIYLGDKGVLLVSGVGCGKSIMMRVMQRLLKDTDRKFRWVNAIDLKDMVEEYGVTVVKDLYGRNLKMDLYIDDIGTSYVGKRFGNFVNIITEIVFERCELFVSSGIKTHFSSNIPPYSNHDNVDSLNGSYGERACDRIVEMCDLVSWNSKSLRK